jgi:hypothetical protein
MEGDHADQPRFLCIHKKENAKLDWPCGYSVQYSTVHSLYGFIDPHARNSSRNSPWKGTGAGEEGGSIGGRGRMQPYLPVDGMEEAEEGVEGGGEAGAQVGGDAAEELGDHVGVLVERRAHLLHGPPDRRRRVAHLG